MFTIGMPVKAKFITFNFIEDNETVVWKSGKITGERFNSGEILYNVTLDDGTEHFFYKSQLRSDFSRHE